MTSCTECGKDIPLDEYIQLTVDEDTLTTDMLCDECCRKKVYIAS
jgi:hypothetical protein